MLEKELEEKEGESKKNKNEQNDKVKIIIHVMRNDSWSDNHETQLGSIYPLFRNHELWLTLCT